MGIKYLSLFSGIGGFELGIQQAYEKLCIKNKRQGLQGTRGKEGLDSKRNNLCADGLTCIGYSEVDKYAIEIYEKHFNHKNYGDITAINVSKLPDFDLIVGGFPDGWTEGVSDTQRYKTLGNAVTVNVIEEIACKLL